MKQLISLSQRPLMSTERRGGTKTVALLSKMNSPLYYDYVQPLEENILLKIMIHISYLISLCWKYCKTKKVTSPWLNTESVRRPGHTPMNNKPRGATWVSSWLRCEIYLHRVKTQDRSLCSGFVIHPKTTSEHLLFSNNNLMRMRCDVSFLWPQVVNNEHKYDLISFHSYIIALWTNEGIHRDK